MLPDEVSCRTAPRWVGKHFFATPTRSRGIAVMQTARGRPGHQQPASQRTYHTNGISAITSSCRDNSLACLPYNVAVLEDHVSGPDSRAIPRLLLVRVCGSVRGTIISGNDYFVCSARQRCINLTLLRLFASG